MPCYKLWFKCLACCLALVLLTGCQGQNSAPTNSSSDSNKSNSNAADSSKPDSNKSDSSTTHSGTSVEPINNQTTDEQTLESADPGTGSTSGGTGEVLLQEPKRSPPADSKNDSSGDQGDDRDSDHEDLPKEGETPDDEQSLDDYSEDGFIEDPIVRDSKLPETKEGWVRFHDTDEIWFDIAKKEVIVGGRICLRRGPLEMFACPAQMKEHESVVALNCSAFLVHGALLAVGAMPGSPVKYEPEYVPASGSKVRIEVSWMEDGKLKTIDAQQMVQNAESKKALDTNWVFGGSIQEEDPNSGQMLYGGDSGMLICVSNFTIATLDIPLKSSELEGNWSYLAFTENIPARGTRVFVTLKPEVEKLSEEDLNMALRGFKAANTEDDKKN